MKKVAIALTVLVILSAAWCGAWLYLKTEGEKQIAKLFADAATNEMSFQGPQPTIDGFPFVPRVTYTQGLRVRNWQASFSTMTISGFPVPGLPVTISFPAGVIAWVDGGREPIALERLDVTVRTPWPAPKSVYEDDLRTWQLAGGEVHITDSLVEYEDMETQAVGTITLDNALQPEADFTARTKGYAALIQKMTEEEKIKPFAGIALLAALNNFAQPDPDEEDGEMIAELPVTIRGRGVYVGPILVQEIPAIVWDTRNPPALRQ